MGWLFQNGPLRHETPVDYLRRELTFDRDGVSAMVLDAAAVKGTVYAAVRNRNVAESTDFVFCAVILFKNSERDGFGYKDMTECMGPCEIDCPDRIMRLLSPVEQIPNPSYAAAWRLRVAENKEQRRATKRMAAQLKPGVTIRLVDEATFGKSGVVATDFQLRYFRKGTPVFEPVGVPGFLCQLNRESLATATIVARSTGETAART